MDKKGLLKNVLLFAIIFLGLNLVFKGCQTDTATPTTPPPEGISVTSTNTTYSRSDTVSLIIQNNTKEDLTIASVCPKNPFDVTHYENGAWVKIETKPELDCSKAAPYIVKIGQKLTIPYDQWNHALFSNLGRFKISADLNGKAYESNEFTVEEEGMFSKLWTGIFYRPIYNILMFLIAYIPGHSLGLAIIILTIIIRTILLMPSQKAMKAQRKMQLIQPMIESIKEKHKGDQQKIAQETMTIWKTHKVNPLGSCLPLLLQFPVLIALFYVVQKGLNPDNTYLLYTTYKDFSFNTIDTNFLWLDLLKSNLYVLPLIVGLLTFAQMKLSTYLGNKKKDDKDGKVTKKNEFSMANNMMVYFMPVMVAVFTASLPAGVGIYWGVSTLYGVVQQYFVNQSKPGPKKDDDSDVKVRVIENKEPENKQLEDKSTGTNDK